MNETTFVVDTNIFFSLLLRRDTALRRRFLTNAAHTLHCPRFFLVELFKHKERIAQATELREDELLECLYELLARVRFVEEGSIPIGIWMGARRLCRDVDPKDAPFVALTLHLDGRLWTGDEELKAGLKAKGFERRPAPPGPMKSANPSGPRMSDCEVRGPNLRQFDTRNPSFGTRPSPRLATSAFRFVDELSAQELAVPRCRLDSDDLPVEVKAEEEMIVQPMIPNGKARCWV